MGKDSSNKLYFGNLPPNTTDKILRDFLNSNGVSLRTIAAIVLKKGYAFIDCSDQTTADLIIDSFQGRNFSGNSITVEPAFRGPRTEHKSAPRVIVSNCSETTTVEDVEQHLSSWGGTIASIEKTGVGKFLVTFSDDQQIDELLEDCKGEMLNGAKVIVEQLLADDSKDWYRSQQHPRYHAGRYVFRPTDFPLRMLIPAEYIGAVIGRGGSTIKGITHETGARVDVYRSNGSRQTEVEKVVTILGAADNCSTACKKILELLAKESSTENRNYNSLPIEISLKMLSSNNLVGRVIGKCGSNIKKIMADTSTKIHVSNQNEYTRRYLAHGVDPSDRIITIRGSIEGMCNAESLISAKMKAAYEVDYQLGLGINNNPPVNENPPGRMYENNPRNNGMNDTPFLMTPDSITQTLFHTMSLRNGSPNRPVPGYGRQNRFDSMYLPSSSPAYQYDNSNMVDHHQTAIASSLMPEKTYLYIPSNFVGAIIGNKGSTIRNMIRDSGATLKIENGMGEGTKDPDIERRVTIFGPLESHWKAQSLIFKKLTEDGRLPNDLKLTLEVTVPSELVGRLIGRGGARIKEIQMVTGTNIKFLTDDAIGDETFAQMFGTFDSLYSAQIKLRQVMNTIQKQRALGGFGGCSDMMGQGFRDRERERALDRERERERKRDLLDEEMRREVEAEPHDQEESVEAI